MTLPGDLTPTLQNCLQPHIQQTTQRLPTLDAWNATVQRQLTGSMSLEVAYIGNKGRHVFAGDGPTYNVNQPSVVGCVSAGCSVIGGSVPQVARRPFYNRFTYDPTLYPDPSSTTGALMCCSTRSG